MILRDHSHPDSGVPMTGDAVICSSNTSTGIGLKTLTSSMWNHSGIAVRILGDGSISNTREGDLYMLEINTWMRKDDVDGDMVVGAGYSRFEWMLKRYNIVAFRSLSDKYRTKSFISKIKPFVDKYKGTSFTTDVEPFFSAWIGVTTDGNKPEKRDTMFCSEFMAHFYLETLDMNNMNDIFGDEGPLLPDLCTPEHYSANCTSKSKVFENYNTIIYMEHSDIGSVLIPIILFTFFIVILIWYFL